MVQHRHDLLHNCLRSELHAWLQRRLHSRLVYNDLGGCNVGQEYAAVVAALQPHLPSNRVLLQPAQFQNMLVRGVDILHLIITTR